METILGAMLVMQLVIPAPMWYQASDMEKMYLLQVTTTTYFKKYGDSCEKARYTINASYPNDTVVTYQCVELKI